MTIYLPVKKLSIWQQRAFAAALIERMLPNYQLFAESCEFGDFALLRNQLDLVWQKLGQGKIKVNIDVQLEKLEMQTPDVEQFDSFGVYPALDTCMALTTMLQELAEHQDEHITQISQLSANSVGSYVELLLEHDNIDITEKAIKQHPLMQWEKASQDELFDLAKNAKENQASLDKLKALALAEGVSNLGIEI